MRKLWGREYDSPRSSKGRESPELRGRGELRVAAISKLSFLRNPSEGEIRIQVGETTVGVGRPTANVKTFQEIRPTGPYWYRYRSQERKKAVRKV